MAEWTNIATSNLEPGKPARSIDALALRDNPIAIAEGAAGAPRIEDAALNTTVTGAGTNWVNNRIAGSSAGAVGTYAFLGRSASGTISVGQTFAGSGLRYSAFAVSGLRPNWTESLPTDLVANGNGGTPAGTWRAMGGSGDTSTRARATLFLRIS